MAKQLPDLRVIAVDQAIAHEETDTRRVRRYAKAFLKIRSLYDPPIVTLISKRRYLVLDGANRVAVFRQLGIRHIVVQVVKYAPPFVELQTWNHLICDQRFKHPASKPVVRFKISQLNPMVNFVKRYNGTFGFYRVVGDNFKKLRQQYPDAACLVVFPRFKPAHIVRLSLAGTVIPSGITRHLVAGRALSINIPLSILRARGSVAEKNRWLKRFISDKIKNHRVRYYAESTFVFYR